MKLRRLIQLKHSREYYCGLGLLLASCLTLAWALWRDSFKPGLFLLDLLIFSWGYALLWQDDQHRRFEEIGEEIAALRSQLSSLREQPEPVAWAQEILETDDAVVHPDGEAPAVPQGAQERAGDAPFP